MLYINPETFQTFDYAIIFHCNINDISHCSMNCTVCSFFSSVTPRLDHKTPQALFSPWIEILFIPNILPAMLKCCLSRSDRGLLSSLSRQALSPFSNLMEKVWPVPRVSAAEAAPQKATGLYKQKLVIISTPIPELCHPPGLLWFIEGQPSATGSSESHLLHFLVTCE